MSLHAHRLNAGDVFLAERRADPVAKRLFVDGDLVVICAACRTPMLAETWVVLGGAHCGQTETTAHLPGGALRDLSALLDADVPPSRSEPIGAVVPSPRPRERHRTVALALGGAVLVAVAVAATYAVVAPGNATVPADGSEAQAVEGQAAPGEESAAAETAPIAGGADAGSMEADTSSMMMYGSMASGMEPAAPQPYMPETVRVDSPGDGFLALRSAPSADYGERVMRMPHGSTLVVIGACEYSDTIGGRTGHWCRVSYMGNEGWAFSAYLVRL